MFTAVSVAAGGAVLLFRDGSPQIDAGRCETVEASADAVADAPGVEVVEM